MVTTKQLKVLIRLLISSLITLGLLDQPWSSWRTFHHNSFRILHAPLFGRPRGEPAWPRVWVFKWEKIPKVFKDWDYSSKTLVQLEEGKCDFSIFMTPISVQLKKKSSLNEIDLGLTHRNNLKSHWNQTQPGPIMTFGLDSDVLIYENRYLETWL